MRKTGITNLPLHHGKAPRWLFNRMVSLGREITKFIIEEFGPEEFLKRISNPYFFQSFGCVLGFDWHSSGLTTTLTGALKQGINDYAESFGLFIAGGKGRTSRKTIEELGFGVEKLNLNTKTQEELEIASKITAKVDNSLIQDNYQLYHHTIFITKRSWVVVQQGMNSTTKYARRYHWSSFETSDFIQEPHSGLNNAIITTKKEQEVLDLTSRKSYETRKTSLDLAREKPNHTIKLLTRIIERQKTLSEYFNDRIKVLTMPRNHYIRNMAKKDAELLKKAIEKSYEIQPKNYEELILIKGFGPKTIRSLALISQIIYGTECSWKDPAIFSFAHGGKDGIPYPVDKKLMDHNIEFLKQVIEEVKKRKKENIKINYNALSALT